MFVRLRPRGEGPPVPAPPDAEAAPTARVFCVGTYHMPCLFRVPPVMTIHTSMLVRHVSRLSEADPFVIAGDFNFVPGSDCYKIVTEGERQHLCLPPAGLVARVWGAAAVVVAACTGRGGFQRAPRRRRRGVREREAIRAWCLRGFRFAAFRGIPGPAARRD